MFLRNSLLSLLTAATSLSVVEASLDPIVIKGNKFFYKTNGTQFYIRGVAYQQDVGASTSGSTDTNTTSTIADPLTDGASCTRDIPYLQKLGTNLIRVYAIDPTQDHSACMNALDTAGIYVLADLGSPDTSISRISPSWDVALYSRYTSVVDSLQNYTNVMGFFAGNEVTNNITNTEASAFVKAAVRDTKAYIAAKGYHAMGVGYAADDDAGVRDQVSDFMNCDSDTANNIDFWGYNIYEWCGTISNGFVTSGYSDRTADFKNYSVPAFFAEYGCNTGSGGGAGRPWQEVGTLFGSQMNDVFSGGIAYEYFEEQNDYGLVSIDGNSVNTLSDFGNLATQIAKSAYPTGTNAASFTPTNTAVRSCPTVEADYWQATSSPLPPTPNGDLCDCMVDTLTCTTKKGITGAAVGELLSTVCSPSFSSGDICAGISTNATTGKYGAYSMCSGQQQLAFVMNQYYNAQSSANKGTACDFSGNGTTQSPSKATGTCAALISQAGTAGTGAVSSNPTAGAGSTTGSSSGGSASASKSKGAAPGTFVPGLGSGWSTFAGMVVYVGGAAAVGASMVWL